MSPLVKSLSYSSQAASYCLGGVVIIAALGATVFSSNATEVAGWALDILGTGFLAALAALVFITVYALVRMTSAGASKAEASFWLETGLLSAGGVTTLALTFTLLGISLGIGGLANQELTPETVQVIIRDLTANFSLAFMTTVIGLPLSALLRALLIITHERRHLADAEKDEAQNQIRRPS